jgi:hypothetical protein
MPQYVLEFSDDVELTLDVPANLAPLTNVRLEFEPVSAEAFGAVVERLRVPDEELKTHRPMVMMWDGELRRDGEVVGDGWASIKVPGEAAMPLAPHYEAVEMVLERRREAAQAVSLVGDDA